MKEERKKDEGGQIKRNCIWGYPSPHFLDGFITLSTVAESFCLAFHQDASKKLNSPLQAQQKQIA